MQTSAEKGIQVRFEGNGPGCRQLLGNKTCCRQVNKLLSSIGGPGHECVLVSLANRFYFFWQLNSLGRGVERMWAGHCLFWWFCCRKVNSDFNLVGQCQILSTRKSATPRPPKCTVDMVESQEERKLEQQVVVKPE